MNATLADRDQGRSMEASASDVERYVLLEGRAPIGDFVRFMRRQTVGGQQMEDAVLAREWRNKNVRIRELEETEAGWADTAEPPELPASQSEYANLELQRAAERNGPAFLPQRWAMVELDRMVVYQKHINIDFADQLRRQYPASPSLRDLIQIALGEAHASPPVKITQIDSNVFTFISRSNDLRALRIAPFSAEQIDDLKLRRNANSVLGVFVGYGSNFLQAVRIRNRTILTNGSHRAYALRALGVTHVPCIVQNVGENDLDFVAIPEVKQNFDRYVVARRPPVLKDYFDERLHRIVRVPRHASMVQVELTIRESFVPQP